MYYGFKQETWTAYNITLPKFNSRHLFFALIYFLSKLQRITQLFSRQFLHHFFLFLLIFLEFAFVLLLITPYSSLAITANTSNIINGNPPYLTLDGGRNQITNTDGLLEISLSNGDKYTPSTNNSSLDNPIVLPTDGQSFADIVMLVPTNTDSIGLSSLIDAPYNYWGDVDGDGQGSDGITATGSLRLSIVDKNNQPVSRNTVLTISNAPYKLTLSNTNAMLKTRYGVPNESLLSQRNVTYYVQPKASPSVCFAKPNLNAGTGPHAGFAWIWNSDKGFLTQSVSSYGLNFPTTGANNLYFDLEIVGSEPLTWAQVSRGGITATMTNSTSTSVRVTLTGPVATDSQWESDNPGNIDQPSLPQVFELIGRDSHGNAIVKYGFELKQWFVNRGAKKGYNYSSISSWCPNIGYRMPKVKDLTNSNERGLGATPLSKGNYYQRHIAAGLFTEWGYMKQYQNANFATYGGYWTTDNQFAVWSGSGWLYAVISPRDSNGLCVYP